MKNIIKLLVALLAATVILTACENEKVEDNKDEEKKEEKLTVEEEAEKYLLEFAENAEDGYILSIDNEGERMEFDITSHEEFTVYMLLEDMELTYTCSEENEKTIEVDGVEVPMSEMEDSEEFNEDVLCPGEVPFEFGLFLDSDFAEDIIEDFDDYEFIDKKDYIIIINEDDEEIHIYKDGKKLTAYENDLEYVTEVKQLI